MHLQPAALGIFNGCLFILFARPKLSAAKEIRCPFSTSPSENQSTHLSAFHVMDSVYEKFT